MSDTQKMENGRSGRVPEFLREPLVAAQARLGHLEVEAQRVLRDLVDRGRAGRKDLEQIVQRLSRQDWTIPELRHRLEKLRAQGLERAAEWRGRAESFRAEAMERMVELQARAVAFLGVATRDQIAELSREIDRLSRRIERGDRVRKGRRKSSAEV